MKTTKELQKVTKRTATIYELEQERENYLNRKICRLTRIDLYEWEKFGSETTETIVGYYGDDFKGTISLNNRMAKARKAAANVFGDSYLVWDYSDYCERYPKFKIEEIEVL